MYTSHSLLDSICWRHVAIETFLAKCFPGCEFSPYSRLWEPLRSGLVETSTTSHRLDILRVCAEKSRCGRRSRGRHFAVGHAIDVKVANSNSSAAQQKALGAEDTETASARRDFWCTRLEDAQLPTVFSLR